MISACVCLLKHNGETIEGVYLSKPKQWFFDKLKELILEFGHHGVLYIKELADVYDSDGNRDLEVQYFGIISQ